MFNNEIIKELTSLGSCPHEPSKINLAAEVREDKNLAFGQASKNPKGQK